MTAPSPKLIFLCTFLFLASALITLTVRTSSYHSHALFSSSSHRKHLTTTASDPLKSKVAFATFLAGRAADEHSSAEEADSDDNQDGYFLGVRVLNYQLRLSASAGTNASIPFLVLVTEDVSARKRATLASEGASIVPVAKLNASWVHAGADRWRDVLAKLRLFELTAYAKICFLDADTLVTGRLDGVFYDEATMVQPALARADAIKDDEAPLPRTYSFATHPDYWTYDHSFPPPAPESDYLNCGFFVFAPSLDLFAYYVSLLSLEGRFDPTYPEQNLLNYAHRSEGNMPWRHLWYGWNVNWPTEKDWRAGARSFHAKYWDGDPTHDKVLKRIWRDQRWEMEGYWKGRRAEGIEA
ncbi:glycosyltransferase family 8 protein [Viridothelium virens]|uniref:Glycosyltransferase family 8 protein n=1 Tax=Viridothelium virens TaxID=1048519 RepID=A0A6A6HJB0_VIRVR|nr:glycosyltransferase family 8 protein [Viridothelium virens]